jgi:hypothetical protein
MSMPFLCCRSAENVGLKSYRNHQEISNGVIKWQGYRWRFDRIFRTKYTPKANLLEMKMSSMGKRVLKLD